MELIGDLDGPVATVSADGTVAPGGAPWQICWAVGAEDRWHVAGEEAAVRSHLIDGMPVVETAMRVPGGDVVQRTAALRDGEGRAVVLEFSNGAPVPVSLAVAVVPASDCSPRRDGPAGLAGVDRMARLGGEAGVHRAEVRGSQLIVDGRVAADLGRAPGGAAAVADGDVWRAVSAGPAAGDCQSSSRWGRAAAAAVVPLTAGTALRVTVPVEGGAVRSRSAGEVAAGWGAVVTRAASVDLPDVAAAQAWRRGIAASILAAGGTELEAAARAAVVLDRVGLPDEADRARASLAGAAERSRLAPSAAASAMQALASRRLRAGRVSGLAELAGPLAAAAGDRLDPRTLQQVAAALDAEAPAAARDARRLLAETTSRPSVPQPAAPADGLAAAVRDSAAFGGDGLAGIEVLLDCLVAEGVDHVLMAPALIEAWRGSAVDARGLVTRHGVLSFSVRWHGARPAVLWELQPHRVDDPAPTVRCGLDALWASAALAGESLLGTGPPSS